MRGLPFLVLFYWGVEVMALFTLETWDGTPKKCDFKDWFELIDYGWKFLGMKDGHAIMSRNGYINEFWEDMEE